MVKLSKRIGDMEVTFDLNEAEVLQAVLDAHGVARTLHLVREALEQLADPTKPEGSNPLKAYIAVNGLDQALTDIGE